MKKGDEKKSDKNWYGISGLTLVIAGFLAFILNPFLGIIFLIVGMVFCAIQQRRQKMKVAKIGLIIGVIGIVLSVLWIIVLIKIWVPVLQQNLQNLPTA